MMEENDLVFRIINAHHELNPNLDVESIRESLRKHDVSIDDKSLETRINEFKASKNPKPNRN